VSYRKIYFSHLGVSFAVGTCLFPMGRSFGTGCTFAIFHENLSMNGEVEWFLLLDLKNNGGLIKEKLAISVLTRHK
jgi:hypothetical protein